MKTLQELLLINQVAIILVGQLALRKVTLSSHWKQVTGHMSCVCPAKSASWLAFPVLFWNVVLPSTHLTVFPSSFTSAVSHCLPCLDCSHLCFFLVIQQSLSPVGPRGVITILIMLYFCLVKSGACFCLDSWFVFLACLALDLREFFVLV